mmetsp:Transcript_4483/g.7423  ORF Transcript_4483/g.7423 Transcript_4483/m.7423 type:complete len:204 (-) Transcript_4483:241-852(-)
MPLSFDPETINLLSGETATVETQPLWASCCSARRISVAASHTLIVLSREPETIAWPLGINATELTTSLCGHASSISSSAASLLFRGDLTHGLGTDRRSCRARTSSRACSTATSSSATSRVVGVALFASAGLGGTNTSGDSPADAVAASLRSFRLPIATRARHVLPQPPPPRPRSARWSVAPLLTPYEPTSRASSSTLPAKVST